MKTKFLIFALTLFASNIYAKNVWYWGEVTQIITNANNGFEVKLSNDTIKTFCKNGRVIFKTTDMGVERTKLAFSMALTAHTSGKKWGVVVDLPTSIDYCYASPTSSQGAGISSIN